ncbi:MAG: hypothetical protein VBE63_25095 [Lamprobacter sp.]|uniref:hypothetical protein n=1 Tax=Lamprobacter sp. TaxID=3100796 RepID=UPI002B26088A|nr:hypothetical protein [Lamprobacter sp.]MEA3643189.1 hypothetical protein [Lamprobacter sp.]
MTEPIKAAQFWDLYFRNLFLRLERDGSGYKGVAYANDSGLGPPAGIFHERPQTQIQVSRAELVSYDYSSDGRFSLFLARPKSIGTALDAIISQSYPYRDPAPFSKERMAQLCAELRERIGSANEREADLSVLHGELSRMLVEYAPSFDQPIAALVWLLGELRQRDSAEPILQVLQNSPYCPIGKVQVHFTALNAGFAALWKINDKASIWKALELMRESDTSGRQKLGALIERLFSTKELLSLDLLEEDYFSVDFWLARLKPYRDWNTNDWDRYDTNALFWELRCLAAMRLSASEGGLSQMLLRDEVATVREAVRQQGNGAM